jgi:hypothetical protein
MEIINNEHFIKVKAAEGYVLTTYKEGDEFINYFSEGALPLSFDVESLTEIPIEDAVAIEASLKEETE